ncbi:MAG: hypothetical protein ACRDLN_17510, partial [Solirubrobacteraceae bacterium]
DDYRDTRVRFSGALKCRSVEDRVGLWMRVDGPRGTQPLAFDNMESRPVRATSEWARHDVVLDVSPDAQAIALGVLLIGGGEAWMGDLAFETVGPDVPVTAATPLARAPQNLDFSDL